MRHNQLLLAPLFLVVATACQIDSGEFREGEIGTTTQATIGGTAALGQDHYDAVAAITILLPSGDNEVTRTLFRYCTGVLIEEKTVLTSGACLNSNLEAQLDDEFTDEFLDSDSVYVQFGSSLGSATKYFLDNDFNDDPMTVKGLTNHRYYNPEIGRRYDYALLRLTEAPSPAITPAVLHTDPLEDDIIGMPIEFVGYGKAVGAAGTLEEFTARNVVSTPVVSISSARLEAGTPEATTCYADGGGPGFIDFGDGPELVSITAWIFECNEKVARNRIDVVVGDFLAPFITYITNGCEGGGCEACEYNGTCEEDCPTRDWDCSLGSFAGDACENSGDCEEAGACIPAADAPEFTYCDKPCEQGSASDCPTGMSCSTDNRCVFGAISPGSQGAACTTAEGCRSGFCENLFCAFECDVSADTCDTDNGFLCLPSLVDSTTTVCRIELQGGGGGFCHAANAPHLHKGERNSLLAGLGLLLLFGIVRRRRAHSLFKR